MLLIGVLFQGAFSRAEAASFQGQFFNDTNLTLNYLSSYTTSTNTINFDWGSSSPQPNSANPGYMNPNAFSARFIGWINCPTTGNYYFETRADDGVRLYLDNSPTPTINDWNLHQAANANATVSLVQGAHRLRLEYFQGQPVSASVSLSWRVPGSSTLVLVPAADEPPKSLSP